VNYAIRRLEEALGLSGLLPELEEVTKKSKLEGSEWRRANEATKARYQEQSSQARSSRAIAHLDTAGDFRRTG
jgi:hypothetical protein